VFSNYLLGLASNPDPPDEPPAPGCPFLNWVFFCCRVAGVLYIFWILIYYWKYDFFGLPFHPFDSVFR
jgi:hypothetical protein